MGMKTLVLILLVLCLFELILIISNYGKAKSRNRPEKAEIGGAPVCGEAWLEHARVNNMKKFTVKR